MRRLPSAFARLLREPHRFGFDAALRVLMRKRRLADPAAAARFMADPGLAFPDSEIGAVQPDPNGGPPRVRVPLIGLTGAAGVLPRLYGTLAAGTARRGSAGLQDFLDMLSHRIVAFFGAAGIKYRLHRSAEIAGQTDPPSLDPISGALLALTGHGTPALVERLAIGPEPLLHYAGFFAAHPRSADRLAAMVSDWLEHDRAERTVRARESCDQTKHDRAERTVQARESCDQTKTWSISSLHGQGDDASGRLVQVRQFAGAWLPLPPDQRTALPVGGFGGAWNCLGVDAALGVQSWDLQGRIVLRIGPLDRAGFEALLPHRSEHERLASLVRAFLGLEIGFAINPVLAAEAGFCPRLDGHTARLGWNTWLAPPGGSLRADATDAVFEAA